jgi:ubiquinone/menaquinone biosynthesis C-methylase UbiE
MFGEWYGRMHTARALQRIEREVFGTDWGVNSYTTQAQADVLAKALRLGPGSRLLDIGAGSGWPALYLAKTTGCDVALTDLPIEAIRHAAVRAVRKRVYRRASFALASGAQLPFRARSFDAVVHTDVL